MAQVDQERLYDNEFKRWVLSATLDEPVDDRPVGTAEL